MSDTDGTWVRLRDDLWWRPGEAAWDAVFAATEKGCDIRWFGDDYHLLERAIRDGQPGVVQRLMAMGMNLHAVSSSMDRWNAMHVAAESCSTVEVFMVLPMKLLTGQSCLGSTPLHIAVQNRNVQAVQWILDQPCCPVEAGYGTALGRLWVMDTSPEAVAIRAAFAARKRWTPLRAAWVGAVVTCAQ